MQCPTSSRKANVGVGYKTLSENLLRFKELECLPFSFHFPSLDDGSGMANTMYNNEGKWHKSCYIRFNCTEQKRLNTNTDLEQEYVRKKNTRQSLSCKVQTNEILFLLQ